MMKKRSVREATKRKIKRAPGEELSVRLGMELGCGGILPRERIWRKRELWRLYQASGSEGADILVWGWNSLIRITGEGCKR